VITTDEALGYSALALGEACLIQSFLLPREPLHTPTCEVSHMVRSFSDVGGDFIDYFCLSDQKLGIYLGDVVGKGLPAAMYAALSMGMLRTIHKTGEEPAAVLKLFNTRLQVRPIPSRYCAIQYAVFDPVNLVFCLANAGLPFPLHLSTSGCRPVGTGGFPAGLFEFATYDQVTIQLAPGDSILFGTDGLSEATDQHGNPFGMDRLVDLCAKIGGGCSADRLLRSIFEAIGQFTGSKQHDDMSAVALKVRSVM
jgi:sigma-B regulation protein RsbU (phosphoserine phosphatase)